MLKEGTIGELYKWTDKNLEDKIAIVWNNNLLYYVLDTSKYEHINETKKILVGLKKLISYTCIIIRWYIQSELWK